MAEYVVACMQADRSGRAEEYADAYNESELAAENNNQMVAGRMESRVSITTIQACFTPLLQHSAALSVTVRAFPNCTASWWCSSPCCHSNAATIIRLAHISYSSAVLCHPCMKNPDA